MTTQAVYDTGDRVVVTEFCFVEKWRGKRGVCDKPGRHQLGAGYIASVIFDGETKPTILFYDSIRHEGTPEQEGDEPLPKVLA